MKPQKKHLELLASQKSQGFPWLAKAYSDYFYLCDSEIANSLEMKKHPARKSAERVREVAAQRMIAERLYRVLKYKLEYYESLFPWLVDFGDESIDDLTKQTVERLQSDKKPIEELEDAVEIYTTDAEREAVLKKKLSKQELFQLALDRYWQKKKPRWKIGRAYERYIGYLYETRGYSVYYHGIVEGFEDLGRDLIAIKGNDIEIVQCKYWSQEKTIHEKHIFQLFGTTVEYWVKNMTKQNTGQTSQFPGLLQQDKIKPTFITSTKLSGKAREFAKVLHVNVKEQFPFQHYPCIKCNISMRNGEKIYHLPFDQQYDRTLIREEKNECYAETVKEAEKRGFRRAFRWRGNDKYQEQP